MYNSVIKSNDADVVTKLNENLKIYEGRVAYMQSVNDYYKENKTTLGHPEVAEEMAKLLDSRVKKGQKTPYPGQFFLENRREIDRIKAVIERVQNNPETVFKSWEFDGGEAVINLANNRLQLNFHEKPSEDQIKQLKKNGFKWAPNHKAWQRPLTHKTMSACDKIDFLKRVDGKKPSEIQPKAPKKSEPER